MRRTGGRLWAPAGLALLVLMVGGAWWSTRSPESPPAAPLAVSSKTRETAAPAALESPLAAPPAPAAEGLPAAAADPSPVTSPAAEPSPTAAPAVAAGKPPAAAAATPPAAPREKRQAVPILIYHELGDGPNNLYLRLSEWEAHVDYLARAGYNTVTLAQLYRHLTSGEPLPEKPVVITFDDGYASFYEHAFPRLRERGFVATLFVITDKVGTPRYVTWEQVREMAAAGIEIGSHTATHPDLRELEASQLEHEVSGSRKTLEEQVGVPVLFFCYPGGYYDEAALAAVQAAGYLGAVTTVFGAAAPGDDPLQWPRVPVSRGDTPKKLQALIDTALARSGS